MNFQCLYWPAAAPLALDTSIVSLHDNSSLIFLNPVTITKKQLKHLIKSASLHSKRKTGMF
ncbi:unnamed protein product [Chondrus crispus]|uniref:Uncharacterized protein n=1 Tax=Chondrus crispus TaxID=2769 RepID=R7Q8K4_CHOCR|nr:unnamed protein product [Chondrus crispus]CDF34862.1 unnamed protein product [Chondrus crispus]|eukprot:XP_005714681.1 unnamed protein product [Chondrus crispus]